MDDAVTETDDPVGVWRYDEACRLAYGPVECHIIALALQVDLHELAALTAGGCPRGLALDILL